MGFGDLRSASTSPAEPSLQPALPSSCWFKSGWWALEHVLAKLRRTQQSRWGQERETSKMKRGVCARSRVGPSHGVRVLPDDKASLLWKVLHDLSDSMPLCFIQASLATSHHATPNTKWVSLGAGRGDIFVLSGACKCCFFLSDSHEGELRRTCGISSPQRRSARLPNADS